MKLKISITAKVIGFPSLSKVHRGPVIGLGIFFLFKSWDGFLAISAPSNKGTLGARGVAVSCY